MNTVLSLSPFLQFVLSFSKNLRHSNLYYLAPTHDILYMQAFLQEPGLYVCTRYTHTLHFISSKRFLFFFVTLIFFIFLVGSLSMYSSSASHEKKEEMADRLLFKDKFDIPLLCLYAYKSFEYPLHL